MTSLAAKDATEGRATALTVLVVEKHQAPIVTNDFVAFAMLPRLLDPLPAAKTGRLSRTVRNLKKFSRSAASWAGRSAQNSRRVCHSGPRPSSWATAFWTTSASSRPGWAIASRNPTGPP